MKGVIATKYFSLYHRHWWPRLGSWVEKLEYSNSVHYGFLWFGVILNK